MAEGVDYAWGRPGGQALVNAGKHFAMRYVPYRERINPDFWATKGLELWEKRDLVEHGLTVGMVWETTANRAKEGYWAGQFDARQCAVGLLHCGMPPDTVIYFAVDFDANVGQRSWDTNVSPWIKAYLDGAASVLGRNRIGIYGGFYVIEWALSRGYAPWGWQTYAWSSGHVSSRAHLLQYWNHGSINGVAVDMNRNLRSDFGQFPRPSGSAPVPHLPDTSVPPPPKTPVVRELPVEINVPFPPQTITVPASVVYREKPNKSADKVKQFGERKTWNLSGVTPAKGAYEHNGKTFYRWALIWLPMQYTNDDFDGRWAYVPIEQCERHDCK